MPLQGEEQFPGRPTLARDLSYLSKREREEKMIFRKKRKSQSITAFAFVTMGAVLQNPSQQHGILQVICYVNAENITVSRGLCLHQPLLSTAGSTAARVERGVGPVCSQIWEGSLLYVQGLRRGLRPLAVCHLYVWSLSLLICKVGPP